MPIQQFVGQYQGRSSNVGALRYVNLFPHVTQDQRIVLFGTPGISQELYIGAQPIRGMLVMGDYLYIVSSGVLYKGSYDLSGNLVTTNVGALSTFTGNVSMASNGQQLMIVDGTYGYIYVPSTNTFTQITAPDFPKCNTVAFLDGYFIVDAVGTNTYYFSALYDGLSWDALDYNAAESAPDNVVAVASTFGFLYVFGQQTTEIWYDSGDPLTVFTRADGMVSNVGLLATYSVAKVGETGNLICWLATTPQGRGFLVANSGGGANQRISTPEVEYEWAQYSTLSDAVAYGYMTEGHVFYVITFPTANKTWVHDFTTQQWHERSTNNGRHWSQNYAFYNNKHLVGSYSDGRIFRMSMDIYADVSYPIQRTLISPTLGDDDIGLVSYQSYQVDMERGVGLPTGQGANPEVMLSWSDDSGHTYCNEIMGGFGAQGNYDLRVIFRRLGRSFRRTWKLRISDPVKVVILNATVKTE